MKGFRIIALISGNKPTSKSSSSSVIDNDFLKVLSPNSIYSFYTYYQFSDNNIFTYNSEKDIDIYKIKNKKDFSININAIVGSNGSGKSTLIEIIYWANYNIGCHLNLIKGAGNKSLVPFQFLDVELIYTINNDQFYKIIFNDSNIFINKTRISIYNEVNFNPENREPFKMEDLPEFFYSIVVNYSHYALNSNETGTWINDLFHKNDGYQTPIVLNPMRTEGNIDINREKRLLTKRLQANFLERVEKGKELTSLRNVSNEKIAESFQIQLFDYLSSKEKEEKDDDKEFFKRKNLTPDYLLYNNEKASIINAINKYFDLNLTIQEIRDDVFLRFSLDYIQFKLFKICRNYKQYNRYKTKPDESSNFKYIDAYIKKIQKSKSHIVFKVKGAILYIKYFSKIFRGQKLVFNNNDQINLSYPTVKLNINDLSELVIEIKKVERYFINTSMLVPPSIFKSEIIFSNNISFNSLSSGEKQKIHSISSIVYHLINLNSVEQSDSTIENIDDDYIHYKNINLIFDEIELYYHPDWQRSYISDLLDYIGKINPSNLVSLNSINIIFLTHSPYILSDIPGQNILYLNVDENTGFSSQNNLQLNTFGANIYDLLKNGFFMNDGFIGEWSKRKIKEIIDWLEKPELENKDYYYQLIEAIGEPIIRTRLRELYIVKCKEKTYDDLLTEIKTLKMLNQDATNKN